MLVQKLGTKVDLTTLPYLSVTEFNWESARLFNERLMIMDSDPTVSEIFVGINSPGGQAWSLLSMIESMQSCSKPVNTFIKGIAASCGALLAICGTGKRFMSPNSFMHMHQIRSGTIGSLPEMELSVAQLKQFSSRVMSLAAARSGMTKAELMSRMKAHEDEWRLTSKQALAQGFVDIIGVPRFTQATVTSVEF